MNASLSLNSGLVNFAEQDTNLVTTYQVFQFAEWCEEGHVNTFFFTVTMNADTAPMGSDYLLICQLNWSFNKAQAIIQFDLLQGVTLRIPCNYAVGYVTYSGIGPAFTVTAARVKDVTNASSLQLTQRSLLQGPGGEVPPPGGKTAFVQIPPFAKTVNINSDVSPRQTSLQFFSAPNDSDMISTQVVLDATPQIIPNGAAYMNVIDPATAPQLISFVAQLQV